MTIDTKDDLERAIKDWLDRYDDVVTGQLGDFITRAEAYLNRRLRVFQMQARKTATSDEEYVELPGDFLAAVHIKTTGEDGRTLKFKSKDEIEGLRECDLETEDGVKYFTLIGGAIELYPAPSDDIEVEMVYYQALPPLDSNTDNWLLKKSPDLYLDCACLQGAIYLEDEDRQMKLTAAVNTAIEDMNLEGERATYSGGALKTRGRVYK